MKGIQQVPIIACGSSVTYHCSEDKVANNARLGNIPSEFHIISSPVITVFSSVQVGFFSTFCQCVLHNGANCVLFVFFISMDLNCARCRSYRHLQQTRNERAPTNGLLLRRLEDTILMGEAATHDCNFGFSWMLRACTLSLYHKKTKNYF